MITIALIGAGQRGYYIYGDYILKHPEDVKLVAVAEIDEERRTRIAKEHMIPEENQFNDWQEMLQKEKLADAMIIATSDDLHYEPLKASLEKGYHILLEKPMSNREDEIEKIDVLAKQYPQRVFAVSHILRYTKFFETIKDIIDSGAIGDVMTVEHSENIGFFHMAHSYVRGNWRNSAESSPIILAKSCHDMDILLYLIGSHCKKVASFGSLKQFRKENAPEGAAKRCIDCQVEKECPYSALRIYKNIHTWPAYVITNDHTEEGRIKALKESDYGKCVYASDNDVCDHQVTIMEFENGVTASFHLSAFTHEVTRVIKVMGHLGEIYGDMEGNQVSVYRFNDRSVQEIDLCQDRVNGHIGHGGGDQGFMDAFIANMKSVKETGTKNEIKTSAAISVESHRMAWAAENSRRTGKIIEL